MRNSAREALAYDLGDEVHSHYARIVALAADFTKRRPDMPPRQKAAMGERIQGLTLAGVSILKAEIDLPYLEAEKRFKRDVARWVDAIREDEPKEI